MLPIVFTPEAKEELQEIASYYEEQVENLGREFLDTFWRA